LNWPLRIAKQLYRDLDRTLIYLVEFASPDVVSSVESTKIDNLRMFQVTKFRDLFLFYIDGQDEVFLIRLIHGKRDVD
jgi:hypothetical protein